MVGCLAREKRWQKRGDGEACCRTAIGGCPDTGQNRVTVVMQVRLAAPRPSRNSFQN